MCLLSDIPQRIGFRRMTGAIASSVASRTGVLVAQKGLATLLAMDGQSTGSRLVNAGSVGRVRGVELGPIQAVAGGCGCRPSRTNPGRAILQHFMTQLSVCSSHPMFGCHSDEAFETSPGQPAPFRLLALPTLLRFSIRFLTLL